MKATKVSKRGATLAAATKPLTIAPEPHRELWPSALAIAAAVIAVFYVYGPAMNGPFLLDDSYLPYRLDNFVNAPLGDWLRGMRPLLMLTFWINFQEAGPSTGPYHFVNVLLHLLNGGFAFLIVRKVLALANVEKARLNILASFASGLFLLHPLQTESVSYIASRSETLSVFFFLAAFTVFLYRRSHSASWPVSALVLILFGAACLSKEHSVVLLGVLLLTDYFWNPGFSFQGVRRNWKLYLPIGAGALMGLFFVGRILQAAGSAGFNLKDFTWYQYFFTECRAFWRYVLFFFLPFGQNIDHDFPASKTVFDHGAVLGLVSLIALIVVAWLFRKRVPLISYGVFVILLLFAPTSSFIPIRDTFVEHRMYLPFIGFLFIATGILQFWRTSRSTLIATLTVVLLIEAGLTYQRNRLYSSAIDIWADSVSKSPNKWRPNFQLAYAYYDAQPQQCSLAVTQFSKTATLQKPDYSLLVDWGLAADCAGNSMEALAKLEQAAVLERSAHVYSQIGMEYAKLSEFPQALDALNTAAKLDPHFGRTYIYRGNVYAMQGKRAEAAAEYQHALEIDPADQYARENLMKLAH